MVLIDGAPSSAARMLRRVRKGGQSQIQRDHLRSQKGPPRVKTGQHPPPGTGMNRPLETSNQATATPERMRYYPLGTGGGGPHARSARWTYRRGSREDQSLVAGPVEACGSLPGMPNDGMGCRRSYNQPEAQRSGLSRAWQLRVSHVHGWLSKLRLHNVFQCRAGRAGAALRSCKRYFVFALATFFFRRVTRWPIHQHSQTIFRQARQCAPNTWGAQ